MLKEIIKKNKTLKKIFLWIMRNIYPIFKISSIFNFYKIFYFFIDFLNFNRHGGDAKFINFYPCLSDRTKTSSIDFHYFYQSIWAFNRIMLFKKQNHIDIGSDVRFVGMLTNITSVKFVDIRPLKINLKNFTGLDSSILNLPFKSNLIMSLSCLHVIEHIGLGRYGDPIDPYGPLKASRELQRVLRKNGRLFLSTPIGESMTQFNSQRIFSFQDIVSMFNDLRLIEVSVVDKSGRYIENIDISTFKFDENTGQDAGLGLFIFEK